MVRMPQHGPRLATCVATLYKSMSDHLHHVEPTLRYTYVGPILNILSPGRAYTVDVVAILGLCWTYVGSFANFMTLSKTL